MAKLAKRRSTNLAGRLRRAEERHTLAAVAAAGVLGLAKRQGVELPRIEALGTPGTYGLAAWALGKWSRNRTLSHVATGLLSVALYELASEGGVGYAPAAGQQWAGMGAASGIGYEGEVSSDELEDE